jgi:threonine-phosphate decarboxylase
MDDIHGGDVWSAALGAGLPVKEIIDFSASINPLFLTDRIKDAVLKSIESFCHYPDPRYSALRYAIGEFINISPENILIGNGSIEFIYLVPRVFKPANILIPIPSFGEYENAARYAGANPIFLSMSERESFRLPAKEIKERITGDVKMVFLCSPHNPTGAMYERDEIIDIVEECERRGIWVVMDEVFIEFVYDFKKISLVAEAVKRKNLIVIRSLTKFFAIPGLRLGYAVCSSDLIGRIGNLQEPWRVNAVANAVGCKVLKETDYINQSLSLICKERDFLFSELGDLQGLRLFPSMTNFIMASLIPPTPPFIKGGNGGINSRELFSRLLSKGILIRDLSTMRGLDNRFFRFAVRSRTDNEKLISAIKEIIYPQISQITAD